MPAQGRKGKRSDTINRRGDLLPPRRSRKRKERFRSVRGVRGSRGKRKSRNKKRREGKEGLVVVFPAAYLVDRKKRKRSPPDSRKRKKI